MVIALADGFRGPDADRRSSDGRDLRTTTKADGGAPITSTVRTPKDRTEIEISIKEETLGGELRRRFVARSCTRTLRRRKSRVRSAGRRCIIITRYYFYYYCCIARRRKSNTRIARYQRAVRDRYQFARYQNRNKCVSAAAAAAHVRDYSSGGRVEAIRYLFRFVITNATSNFRTSVYTA